MQITVKSIKLLKEGENKYGAWALYKVVTDEDAEYTTLHKEAGTITEGMTIDIDELSITEREGKEQRSFKKFEVITAATVQKSTTSDKPNGMTPDAWAEKDRLERFSIESQVAFKGIIAIACEYIKGGIALENDCQIKDVLSKALDWAMAHFTGQTITKKPPEAVKSKSTPPPPESGGMIFANKGEFYTACLKKHNMQKTAVDAEVSDIDLSTPEGRGKAWLQIVAVRRKPDEAQSTEKKEEFDSEDLFF